MSNLKKIEAYNGFTIYYNEDESEFVGDTGKDEDTILRADKLKALKEKIDKSYDEPKIIQPKQNGIQLKKDGYHCDYNFKEVTVGAFGMKRRWSGSAMRELYAWVTFKGKSRYGNQRERVRMDDYTRLYKDTPEAREVAKKVLAISEKVRAYIEKYKKEQEALVSELEEIRPTIDADKLPNWE